MEICRGGAGRSQDQEDGEESCDVLDIHGCHTRVHSNNGYLHKTELDKIVGWIMVGIVRPNV